MKRSQWLSLLSEQRAIAVLRPSSCEVGLAMAKSVAAAGLSLIEVTWNSEHAETLIAQLRQALPHCWIGTGTLFSSVEARAAIAAGAQFCFMPHTQPSLIEAIQARDIPAIAGALTPTEIVTAWQAGASSVKVFPVQALGGAAYVRQLQGPLGHIPLIPTGGVTLENGRSLLAAGAAAIGLSSALFPTDLVQAQDWSALTRRAESLRKALSCPA